MPQIHKKFTDEQVKELMECYLHKKIERKYLQQILGIGKARFFALLQIYRANPKEFSIGYHRPVQSRISRQMEKNILRELSIEQQLIQNKEVPLKSYNYSYIKDRLEHSYKQKVSLPTIIDRAKKHGFYLGKHKKSTHDRELLTRYAGELIQHDSSYHLFSPPAGEKWHLITSLDDYSRFILYATLRIKETSWAHIQALQSLFLKYGVPYFRFQRALKEKKSLFVNLEFLHLVSPSKISSL